jgi:hypothetical protein
MPRNTAAAEISIVIVQALLGAGESIVAKCRRRPRAITDPIMQRQVTCSFEIRHGALTKPLESMRESAWLLKFSGPQPPCSVANLPACGLSSEMVIFF